MPNKPSPKNQTKFNFSLRALVIAGLSVPLAAIPQTGLANGINKNGNMQLTLQQGKRNLLPFVNQKTRIPKIQLAIILDTSNSMDGLIDQTRNQLWQVVNEFSAARQDGVVPVLEIALFEYGNDSNTKSSGYVRMLNEFTRELDKVSEGLFSLTTNGGSEYCGFAIETAVNDLQWSRSNTDIKSIFIAGNEAFTQGPVDFHMAVKLASRQGISINTIHAGGYQKGIAHGWQTGAMLAGGDYMSIDANQQVVHIDAPQDAKISELNTQLNQTYLPYGSKGADKLLRQEEQDALSSEISIGLLAKRAKSKSSAFYSNSNWDLVDALNNGEVDKDELLKIEDADLPEPMKSLSSKERIDYVIEKARQREMIKQEITELSELRAAFVAEAKREQFAASPAISDALTSAIKKQAKQKDFVFEK